MNRLLCFSLLLLIVVSPVSIENPAPDCPLEPQYTIRMPSMSYLSFVAAADDMIRLIAPEWYIESTTEVPITIHVNINLLKNMFGQAWKDKKTGGYRIVIGRTGLFLSVVEDLASVLLHEYVHIKVWDEIESKDWPYECKMARHELEANKVVIGYYEKIGYTPHLYENSLILYAQAQIKAVLYKCPAEVREDMPFNPENPVEDSSLKLN